MFVGFNGFRIETKWVILCRRSAFWSKVLLYYWRSGQGPLPPVSPPVPSALLLIQVYHFIISSWYTLDVALKETGHRRNSNDHNDIYAKMLMS